MSHNGFDMIDRLISREGGAKVTNDPADPGGKTKYGISQRSYPTLDIDSLTYDQARMIFINDYLLKTGIGKITDPVLQEMLFDYAVHSGPVAAVKCVQKLAGVPVDGKMGPVTLKAVNSLPADKLVSAIGRERISYLIRQCQSTPSKLKFLNGWIMRVLTLYT